MQKDGPTNAVAKAVHGGAEVAGFGEISKPQKAVVSEAARCGAEGAESGEMLKQSEAADG